MTGGVRKLFVDKYGVEPLSIVKLNGAGSNRVYYRLHGDGFSVIAVVGTSFEENRAFVALADAFAKSGVDAPEVLAVSDDGLCYLQTDLGDTTLFESMKQSRENGCFAEDDVRLLCEVMSALPRIQYEVPRHFDFSLCYPMSDFNERTIKWDLNYFKYCFLKGVGIEFNESLLEDEFDKLTALLLSDNDDVFLYRDFQSRNVMVFDGKPFFIDFQGGRKGPVYYDVASFIGQARACYTNDVVEKMIDAYLVSLSEYKNVSRV
jgi:aminoglycoside/choline kinase family phosphotransferase